MKEWREIQYERRSASWWPFRREHGPMDEKVFTLDRRRWRRKETDAVMIAKDATFNVKKKGRAHCGVAFAVARRHHLTFQHYYGLKSDTQRSSSARV